MSILLAIFAVLVVALTIVAFRFTPIVRARAIQILEERYQSKVALRSLKVSLFPRVSIEGAGLEFRQHGRTDVPPLVTIREFHAHAELQALLNREIHIGYLRLDGLRLTIPPHGSGAASSPGSVQRSDASGGGRSLVIDEVDADGTLLEILPKAEGKEPLEFEIRKLNLRSAGVDRPMEFRAELTNPKPPGLIESTGHFGPWKSGEPGETPVDGHYTFSDADLSVFHGISGKLSSVGDYSGKLNRIEVRGTTDVPDFAVSIAGRPVHLETTFHAFVDGTDGNTYLEPVNASFLKTQLICQGKVEGKPGEKGKTVELDVRMDRGRMEDLLRLAVKGDPVMTGPARLYTKFLLPPGPEAVVEKLGLDGHFEVDAARFTKGTLQEKIADLSSRAQGRPGQQPEEPVASKLVADFTLHHGTASLHKVTFQVPGASVQLQGDYGLVNEQLDFHGLFRMQAKVSQAFTGWKSVVLKAADPFFAKHGAGTEVHLHISGTRDHPSFGIDLFGSGR